MIRGLAVLAMLAVFALGSSGASAARPASMSWQQSQGTTQNPVEQQTPGGATQPDRSLWVVNPTGCPWDPDDVLAGAFTGRLGKGESASHTDCLILDKANHLVGIKVADGLIGHISITGVVGPTFTGSTEADDCLLTPEYGDPEYLALPEIEGSNGGHGDVVSVTWTITNVSGKPFNHNRVGAFTMVRLSDGNEQADWGCT